MVVQRVGLARKRRKQGVLGSLREFENRMTHQRVTSSYIFSMAHDGADTMEVRFRCPRCSGPGTPAAGEKCGYCDGRGHTGTCRGQVPESVFLKVMKGPSIGQNFNRFVKAAKTVDGRRLYPLQKLENLPPEAA